MRRKMQYPCSGLYCTTSATKPTAACLAPVAALDDPTTSNNRKRNHRTQSPTAREQGPRSQVPIVSWRVKMACVPNQAVAKKTEPQALQLSTARSAAISMIQSLFQQNWQNWIPTTTKPADGQCQSANSVTLLQRMSDIRPQKGST